MKVSHLLVGLLVIFGACDGKVPVPATGPLASSACPPGLEKQERCTSPIDIDEVSGDTVAAPLEEVLEDTTNAPGNDTGVVRAGFYVSASGSSSGTGSIDQPWNLQTALSHPSAVQPGDTIWVRGGTYRGTFQSYLDGTSSAPVIVRAYPGERATIDGQFTIDGSASYTWFWGLEFMSSDLNRISNQTGSQPTDLARRSLRLEMRQSLGIKLINLVVHDLGNGIGWWVQAVDSEIHGSVVYNNGWQAPDRGHGHGIYTQNQTGWKVLTDNIVFNNFAIGIQAYGSSAAYVENYKLTGNVFFGPGALSSTGGTYNVLMGQESGGYTHQIELRSNVIRGATPTHNSVNLGYGSQNGTLLLDKNLFYSNVTISNWATVIGSVTAPPSGTQVVVRPNAYEAGRANVTIVNPSLAPSVSVDLSNVLKVGDTYEVRNAQDFYAAPVASGTYGGGGVSLPTTGLSVAQPIGNAPKAAVPTGPEFNVFVVLRTN